MGYEEFMKLWKGFFYCFWLSDKTDGQHRLAEIISKFVFQLPTDNKNITADSAAFLFIRTFWETMGREWHNLDHLRLNKYYYFIGRVLFESFNLIEYKCGDGCEWSVDLVKAQNAVLSSSVFDFKNLSFPMSIRAYIIENYFSILNSAVKKSFSADISVLVCEPIISAVAFCDNKIFFSQFSEALIQGILPQNTESDLDDDMECESEEFEENSQSDSEFELDENNALEVISDDQIEGDSCEDSGEDRQLDEEKEEEENSDEEMDSEIESESVADFASTLLNYSKLGKFIFEFGGREEVLVRNRRFLFDLSNIIDEINSGRVDCCDSNNCCGTEEACH
jgi:ribosomal RNA-processing protein 1